MLTLCLMSCSTTVTLHMLLLLLFLLMLLMLLMLNVTLHYITVIYKWPKYKTAKPLSYAVYRTRN